MNRCPHCGASLQQQAQFCLHCMHSLQDKPDVTPRRKKKTWAIFLTLGLCLAVVLAVLLWPEKPAPEEAEETLLTNFADFSLQAVYLSGKYSLTDIWDPDSLTLTHTVRDREGDQWDIYYADTRLEGVSYRSYFCEGGLQVVTAITGLTEETYDKGLALAECSIKAAFNSYFDNLQDMLYNTDAYPRTAEQEDILTLAALPDPAAEKLDPGAEMHTQRLAAQVDETGHLLYVDVRTRIWQGETYYDILVLCTQAFED